jgi:hypothetical protein
LSIDLAIEKGDSKEQECCNSINSSSSGSILARRGLLGLTAALLLVAEMCHHTVSAVTAAASSALINAKLQCAAYFTFHLRCPLKLTTALLSLYQHANMAVAAVALAASIP